MLDYDYK